MRSILGVLVVGLLVGCGGEVETQPEQELPDTTAQVDAMAAPLPPPFCEEYVGAACSRSGVRIDCMWDWTVMGTCYCNGTSWQCS